MSQKKLEEFTIYKLEAVATMPPAEHKQVLREAPVLCSVRTRRNSVQPQSKSRLASTSEREWTSRKYNSSNDVINVQYSD